MSTPVHDAAGAALQELLEVSPQVDAAVILERSERRLVASAPAATDRAADRLVTSCIDILEAADAARDELGREPIAQVEVGTPDGHLFIVADARWAVAAVTGADPTVGLVFYDLKTALRAVREAGAGTNGTVPMLEQVGIAAGDDSSSDDDEPRQGSSRWRRRKP